MTFKKFLDSLTLEQAREWDATSEKWLWIDYNIMCDQEFLMIDETVNAIEERFEKLLSK